MVTMCFGQYFIYYQVKMENKNENKNKYVQHKQLNNVVVSEKENIVENYTFSINQFYFQTFMAWICQWNINTERV